jgi:predicted nuclease of predicted toxin-antitoxin system
MRLKFLVDTQLPPSLSVFLSSKGFDSIHTLQFANGHLLKDADIVSIAKKENRIIVSKDSDFKDLFFLRGFPPAVLILELGNIKNKDLLIFIENNLNQIMHSFQSGYHLVIVGKNHLVCY